MVSHEDSSAIVMAIVNEIHTRETIAWLFNTLFTYSLFNYTISNDEIYKSYINI